MYRIDLIQKVFQSEIAQIHTDVVRTGPMGPLTNEPHDGFDVTKVSYVSVVDQQRNNCKNCLQILYFNLFTF